jgi:hypothetical protein
VQSALAKESFCQDLKKKNVSINPRQKKVLVKLPADFEGKLTHAKLWTLPPVENAFGLDNKIELETAAE